MEVFQNQHEIIVREFLKQNFEEMNLKKLIMQCGLIPYFYYVSDKVANEKIIELHEICITKFKLIWEHLEKNTACLDKELISTLWLKYLKCISFKTDESVCPLIKEYLKLLQKGILKRNIQALHYISAFITPQSEYSNLGLSVSTVTTKTIHDFIHVNSINLKNFFSDPFLSCDLIRNGILTWFTDKKSNDLEKMLNNRLEMSPITAALSFGLSGLMLGVISIKNRNRRIVNDILSLI